MSEHTDFYVGFFTEWHRTNEKYGIDQEKEELIPLVPMEDCMIHWEDRPFCDQWTCPCHQDRENVNALTEAVEQGLLTTVEANMIMRGATI